MGLFKHLFIPHYTNNHRAKILHPEALFAYVLFFALFNIFTTSLNKSDPTVLGYATNIFVDQLLMATNAQRVSNGLSPLVLNDTLSKAAAMKANNMFANNYWAHTSPDGKTPWEFIITAGYRYSIAGENLAKNFSDSQGVVNAWMDSPSHRDNVLKPGYRDVGFAVVNGKLNGEETTLVVQMFGAPTKLIAQKTNQAVQLPLAREIQTEATTAPDTQNTPVPLAYITTPTPEVRKIATVITGTEKSSRRQLAVASAYSGVSLSPVINIATLTKSIVFLFIGILFVVFAIDVYVVSRKRIIRVSGDTIAHALFFSVLLVAILLVKQGIII